MKLKQITKFFFCVFLVITISSCNDDSTTTSLDTSADAQIYSFKLAAKPDNAKDSVNYPILKNTLFSIDQLNRNVFNRDSLPYQTRLKKFAVTLSYSSSATPYKVELIYPDSVADWNGSDSVDFSTEGYPRFKVTAANGTTVREYSIDLRIRKVDPDFLVWNKASFAIPSSVKMQKTLLTSNDGFYTFSIDKDNLLYLHKTDKEATKYETKQPITGLSASNILLESITQFNEEFYALDNLDNAYNSTDGIDWYQKNANVKAILGVLPSSSANKDSLLVIQNNGGIYSFAKSLDLVTLKTVRQLSTYELDNFSLSGFSSVTNYDRSNLNRNILTVTGGKKSDNNYSNLTWSIQVATDNEFRLISNQQHKVFTAKKGIVSFMYDGYLYALTDNDLYKSAFGYSWIKAPEKEQIGSGMISGSSQSVIVDESNRVWIFGGVSDSGDIPVLEVLTGRLNKLNPI